MGRFTLLEFIDFLQDNFKTELYRNDVKSIIDKLTTKQFDLVDSSIYQNVAYQNLRIDNRVFLYAFFLLYLDVNILPYLEKSSSYTSEAFECVKMSYPYAVVIETLHKLKTLVVPGDKKVIKGTFFKDTSNETSITKIIIEEGVEIIEYNAFSDLENLQEIYLPASLRSFGDIEGCNDNITIYYKPVLKSNGKKGVGFRILSLRENHMEWFKSHLKKY